MVSRSGRADDGEQVPGRKAVRALPSPPPPPGVDLRCLAGVRALASIGVVLFHCWAYWQIFLSYEVKHALGEHSPLIKLASAGMVWVDVLFVLSAMLAALQLLPPLEDARRGAPPCRSLVLAYWRRRARRVLPAYLAANALAATAAWGSAGASQEAQAARWLHFYHCPRTLWANLLLIQNWLGNQACAIHLWTVALQAQFYAALPLALWALQPRRPGFRARLAAALAAALAGGTAWRLRAAWRAEAMRFPVSDFAVDAEAQRSWAAMLHATYLPTPSRVAELALGAGLGLLLRSPAALQRAKRRRTLVAAAALALQATFARQLLQRHLVFRAPGEAPWPDATTRLHLALAAHGSPFMAALAATSLLALALHADPLHAAAARVLGSAMWEPLERLSYCLYLVHEQARLWAALLLPPGALPRLIAARPLLGFAAVSGGTLAAGYACAAVLHVAVERRWA